MNVHSMVMSPDDKRERILAAALELFVVHGFQGTSVPKVARKAGVAAGTIYHYFPSKTALVNALFRQLKQAIGSYVYTAFPAGASFREQFGAMWGYMARFALDNPSAFAFMELHQHGPYLDDESRAMENQLKDFGAGFVSMAQEAGALKKMNTVLMMEMVFGAFIGMMRAHYEGRVELDADQLAAAEGACWDAIAEHPRPNDLS